MIPFFRKIRKKLANDNQFFKYSRYAIGEIILVVIGILIALQINNWNEERKTLAKFDRLLHNVQKELSVNIANFTDFINYSQKKDSILYIINNRLLTNDMIKKNIDFTIEIYNRRDITIQDEAFKNLTAVDIELNPKQDSIMAILKEIYILDRANVDKYNDHVFNKVQSNLEELSKTKKWFTKFQNRNFDNDIYDYFLNDPYFYNDAMNYTIYQLGNLNPKVGEVRFKCLEAHRLISKYHNENDTLLTYKTEDYKLYEGVFKDSVNTLEIKANENKFIMFNKNNNEDDKVVAEIFPITKTSFSSSLDYGFFYLTLNEDGKVEKLKYNYGNYYFEFSKVE